MKITAVDAIYVAGIGFPDVYPAWSSGRVWNKRNFTIVTVTGEDGLTGIGACERNLVKVIREQVAPQLVGQDAFASERYAPLLRRTGAYIVDMALWDLIGKACGQPLYRLWGAYTDRVPAYCSLAEVGEPERRAEDCLRLLDEGYRAVKLRLHNDTIKEDVALVEAVRRAVGDRMEIMCDANQAAPYPGPHPAPAWDFRRAYETAVELERLGCAWLEEPLRIRDFGSLRRLRERVAIPIAGGESHHGLHEFQHLLDEEIYDILQPDAQNSDGLAQLRKIAAAAELRHKQFIPHNGASGIGIAVHLHLSASIPNAPWLEFMYDPPNLSVQAFQSIISPALTIDKDGCVPLPQAPGLGIELDHDLVNRHRVE